MENVLLNENQRFLMNYQKAKVIESGSTSNSNDKCVEPAELQACDQTETYQTETSSA